MADDDNIYRQGGWTSGYDVPSMDNSGTFNPNQGPGSSGNPFSVNVTGQREWEPPNLNGMYQNDDLSNQFGMMYPGMQDYFGDGFGLGNFNPSSNDWFGQGGGGGGGMSNGSQGQGGNLNVNNSGSGNPLNGISDWLFGDTGLDGVGYGALAAGTALKQWGDAGQYMDTANEAANRSDPFHDWRQPYQEMYADLWADPSQVENTPGYQFSLNQGIGALDRSNAAAGNLGSGKASKDVMDYSQGLASQTYNSTMDRLGNLVGAQFDPANAGRMLMTGQTNAINSQNQALGTLASIFSANAQSRALANRGSDQPQFNINVSPSINASGGNAQGGGAGTPSNYSSNPGNFPAQMNGATAAWLRSQGIDPSTITGQQLNHLFTTGSVGTGIGMQQLMTNNYGTQTEPRGPDDMTSADSVFDRYGNPVNPDDMSGWSDYYGGTGAGGPLEGFDPSQWNSGYDFTDFDFGF